MKKTIPFFDISRQHAQLKKEIFDKIEMLYEKGEFTYGKDTVDFEQAFAKLCHTRFALGVRSGTASLIVALKALELSPGDEVITTPVSFSASADAIVLAGAIPRFVDIDSQTGNISPDKIEKYLSTTKKKAKGLLIVHLYGVPCEMDKILKICRKNNLFLIEDSSHAHGSLYNNIPVGSMGVAGCFSLYPSKILGSIGNAGVITTNDQNYLNKLRMYANHGIKDLNDKYTHYVNGYNELIDNIQAAVLSVKTKSLKKWIKRKLEIAQYYNKVLEEVGVNGMKLPTFTRPSLYVYAFQMKDRERFRIFLSKKGVATGVYYPLPLHLQPNFMYLHQNVGTLPNAEHFASQTVSLPLFPELTDDEVEYVVSVVKAFFC